ncbi:hypothetical protein GCM10009848_26000 [Micromonospora lupini]
MRAGSGTTTRPGRSTSSGVPGGTERELSRVARQLSTTSGWPGTGSWYVCNGVARSAGDTTGVLPSAGR